MSLAALEQEIAALPENEQDRLAAMLVAIRLRHDGGMEEISRRLDDKTPESWISWEDAKRELDLAAEDDAS